MRATLEDFKTGWYGISLELSSREIDALVDCLRAIQRNKSHFHFRSSFEGDPGVGDIEVGCSGTIECGDLTLDTSPPIEPDDA